MKLNALLISLIFVRCFFFTSTTTFAVENTTNNVIATSEGERAFGNILIVWEPAANEIAVNATVKMGGALIDVMHFTPDTLKQSLNYCNPPQSATGTFVVEFNATGEGGKLYVENLNWVTKSNTGSVTTLVGVWSTNN